MGTNLNWAKFYTAKGWNVSPVEATLIGTNKSKPRKKNVVFRVGWGTAATTDETQVNSWFSDETDAKFPKQGIAIATGEASDLWVWDADNMQVWDQILAEYATEAEPFPETYTVKSQSGSQHFYFKWPTGKLNGSGTGTVIEKSTDGYTNRVGGIDVRGNGGAIFAPPTNVFEPDGITVAGSYELVKNVAPADAPSWLIQLYNNTVKPKREQRPRPKIEDYTLSEGEIPDGSEEATEHVLRIAREQFQDIVDRGWGASWDNEVTSVMGALVRLVNSPWSTFDEDDLDAFLRNYAPEDAGFGEHDHMRIKNSCFRMADGDIWDMPAIATDAEMAIAQMLADNNRRVEVEEERTDKEGPFATIPDEFWEARPLYTSIRNNAWHRIESPDATLHTFLAAYAARIPWQYELDTGMNVPAQPIFFTVICAESGVGKGGATALGFNLAKNELRPVPFGTGEGLVEYFLETQVDTSNPANFDKNGDLVKNPTTKKVQTKHNILVSESEGTNFITMMDRPTSSLTSTVLKMGVGEALGMTNAYESSSRFVDSRTYAAGLVVGAQYGPAGQLLERHGVGLSQRFLWASVIDPNAVDLPDPQPEPVFEEPLPVIHPAKVNVMIDPAITAPMRGEKLAIRKGEVTPDPQDSHRIGIQLRLAMILRFLEGPNMGSDSNEEGVWKAWAYQVTMEDWRLAGILYDTSKKLRQQLVARVRKEQEQVVKALGQKDALRSTAKQEAETDLLSKRTREGILRMIPKLEAEGTQTTAGYITRRLDKRYRSLVPDIIVQMVMEGVLVVSDTTEKATYKIAQNTPAKVDA